MISRGIGKSAARSVARSLSQFGSGGVAPSYDTDAQTYITAVETADGQSLETGVKDAINAFVVGCKADGIWTAIKASCILAGARTLTGALVPLVGTAPTNNNFVSGDYNRKTGLVGNGSTKYLDSNRNNNADPQNDNHNAVFTTSIGSAVGLIGQNGASVTTSGSNSLSTLNFRNRNSSSQSITASTGFLGISRTSSSGALYRTSDTTTTVSYASQSPTSATLCILGFPTNAVYGDSRLSFYSIGESLDLALLDFRVSTLMTAIGAAIP